MPSSLVAQQTIRLEVGNPPEKTSQGTPCGGVFPDASSSRQPTSLGLLWMGRFGLDHFVVSASLMTPLATGVASVSSSE